MYWTLSTHSMLQKSLNILFLYLYKFDKNRISISKFSFRKIPILWLSLISISQKIVQIVCNICWFFVTHICSSNIYKNLFCEIYENLWDFIGVKLSKFQVPNYLQELLAVERTANHLSTGWSTDVHKRRAQDQPSRQVNRAVDRLKAPNSRVLPINRSVER